jgi:hypothetical protein
MKVPGLNSTQEEEIHQLLNKFEEWRKGKKSVKDRIPAELWTEAVQLAEKYSVFRVSKRLRLSYMDLKKRMRNWNGENASVLGEERDFLELKVSSRFLTAGRGGMSPCIMEIIRSDGAQLRVYSRSGAPFDIMRICEGFMKN